VANCQIGLNAVVLEVPIPSPGCATSLSCLVMSKIPILLIMHRLKGLGLAIGMRKDSCDMFNFDQTARFSTC
jgi:hypothetical protein